MIQPRIIPDFDVLQWKREIQTEIYEETKNMSTKEVLDYFRRGAERFDEEQKQRRVERTKK